MIYQKLRFNRSLLVVVDLVAGPGWPALLEVLKRGGRYVTAGAIAGPESGMGRVYRFPDPRTELSYTSP